MKDKILMNLKWLFILLAIMFAIPSIIYMIQNKTVYDFDGDLEYCFLLANNVDRLIQAGIYFVIVVLMVVVYYLLIKNRKSVFKNMKQVYALIIVVSLIFVFVLPFWCSDVFYYLGIGRLTSKYHQNPYYENIKDYIDSNNINIENDTVIRKSI